MVRKYRETVGVKEIGIDLVDIGFDEEAKKYYTTTRFKCNGMDNPSLLAKKAAEMEAQRGCSIEIKGDAVYLTNYFDVDFFKQNHQGLIDIAKEGKCPKRLDPAAVELEIDICILEQEDDSVAFFLGATKEDWEETWACMSQFKNKT